ncbi:MAG: hypothetical protein WAW26_09740, partial [Anaerolineae bacterium]
MQRQRTVIFMIVLALALLTALLPAASLPSAAQEPPIVTTAIPSDHSSPQSAFRSSAVIFIENSGQWPAAARFQVWGGPIGTMWLAEDAIWITVMQPVDRRQATEDRGQGIAEAPDWHGDPAAPPTAPPLRGVNIKLSFVDANPHPHIESFDRLDTKVSYFIGADPDQ